MKNFIKSKTLGVYISVIPAIIALVTVIYYMAMQSNTASFLTSVLLFLIAGIVMEILHVIYTKVDVFALLQVIAYGLALGAYLKVSIVTVVNIFNGIVPESADPYLTMYGFLGVCTLIACVSCFFNQDTKSIKNVS